MSVRSNEMKIIAHRGASADAPENTLAAIRLAWDQQADGVEIDVRLTRDGHVVVIHDESTRRTTGTDIPVDQADLADLGNLDAGRWYGAEWEGERIPLLADVLVDQPPDRHLYVEIKCGTEILTPLEELARHKAHSVSWVGFSSGVLHEARARFPDHRIFWNIPFSMWHRDLSSVVRQARQAGFSGLGLETRRLPEPDEIGLAHENGLTLFMWTVDDPALAGALMARGVDSVVTNRPGWLRSQLESATG